MRQIVTTLAAALAVALAGQAHGQTDRRWTGASNADYGNAGNWSDPDVPNTTSEAILVDGNNAGRDRIFLNIDATVDYTIPDGVPARFARLKVTGP